MVEKAYQIFKEFKLKLIETFLLYVTRDCSLTHTAHFQVGDCFHSRPYPASKLRTLKMVPTAEMSGERQT